MKLSSIRLVIFLGILAISGIIFIQWYWLKLAYNKQEAAFNDQVTAALTATAYKLSQTYNATLEGGEIVKRVNSNYYIVNVNTHIDYNILETYLKEQLQEKNVKTDFEYGIFDCESKQMIYGNYFSFDTTMAKRTSVVQMPEYPGLTYYFGIRFPSKNAYFAKSLDMWFAFSGILLVALSFFGYAMFVIYKQRKQYQQQRDFVSNMTHEFKTPLASVKIAADYLDKQYSATDDRSAKYISIIKNQNTRLNKLVESVLQNALSEKNDFKLNLQNHDMVNLLHEIVHTSQIKNADVATINFNTTLTHCNLPFDEVHITNCIESVLENAIKYSDLPAIINITIADTNKQTIIAIADNGFGIDAKYFKSIFKKFYRIPTGNVHNKNGYGLGLFYVYNIILKHNWKLKLQSQIGKGSTFSIVIPKR